jgi:hypothetical protein
MSTTVNTLVEEVRSKLQGSLPDTLNVLAQDYTPGDGVLHLRYPANSIRSGTQVCSGLNTWHVLAADNNGQDLVVFPSADGGVETTATANDLVRISPRFTTWAIFREWNNQLASMSSPGSGLYGFGTFTSATDYAFGTYPLPTPDWDGQEPIRLLRARWQRGGTTDVWTQVNAEYQPENRLVRVKEHTPGPQLEFVLAFPFLLAATLADDPAKLGVPDRLQDIPGLGAAATLALSTEGRRNQVLSQGDTRRATEVPPGANIGGSRMWSAMQKQRIQEEASRLSEQFPYRMPMPGGLMFR